MKKILASAVMAVATFVAHAQTATNFNCADCAGTTHDLFTELDAGKVIVLVWVMPCGSCTGPALTTYNVVQSYQGSDPDRVRMYLCDDYANTSCAALNGWKNANGLTNTTTFSNAAINMSDYGGPGMPKIVVLGGADHSVFYTANNTVNATALQNAINDALTVVGMEEESPWAEGFSIHPVPATVQARITFTLAQPARVVLDLYDLSGQLVKNILGAQLPPGPQQIDLVTDDLPSGSYVVRITNGTEATHRHLVIAR